MMKIKKILVPVDFSPSSKRALSCALVFARKCQAKLFILACSEGYVIGPEVVKGHRDLADQQTHDHLEMIKAQSQKETEERLSKFLEEAFGEELPEHERLVVYGTPHEQIIRTAKQLEMDMIILGTMGKTRIERLMLGSTAEKVVRLSHCPVMTVRREE
jgi:nucleotide-binding universal stress UspA family protein